MSVPRLCLIDPDMVEVKNVGRQLFSPSDVGYPKAEVVAKRLALAFGLPIEWRVEPFEATRQVGRDSYGTILIDAVDNEQARRELAKASQEGYGRVLISCGNHRDAGQVSIGNCGTRAEMDKYLAEIERRQVPLGNKDSLHYLPTAYLLFPDLLAPEAPASLPAPSASCADLMLEQEQDVFINDAMALVAARYVQQLLLRQAIQSFLTFVSLSSMMSVKPVPITLENLRSYLGEKA